MSNQILAFGDLLSTKGSCYHLFMGRGTNQSSASGGGLLFGSRGGKPTEPKVSTEKKAPTAFSQIKVEAEETKTTDYLGDAKQLLQKNPYFMLPAALGLNVIVSTSVFAEKDNKAGSRAHVAIAPIHKEFVGFVTSGPAVAPGAEAEELIRSKDLDEVLAKINEYAEKKVKEDGCAVYLMQGKGTQDGKTSREDFDAAYAAHPRIAIEEKYGSRLRS